MQYPLDNAENPGGTVTYGYHPQLTLNNAIGLNNYVQSTSYDAAGRITQRRMDSASGPVMNFSYYDWGAQGGTLHTLISSTEAGPLQNLSYTYDQIGNITGILDTSNWMGSQTLSFTYDNLDRLLNAGASGGNMGTYQESYTYNPTTGNLLTKNGVTYNYNGNMTTRVVGGQSYNLAYDGENHMVSVTGAATASFAYDGDGQRVKGVSDGKTTYYVNPFYEVEQSDKLALSVESGASVPNGYTYRTFDNTATYTIQSGDVLECYVYLDSANPQCVGRGEPYRIVTFTRHFWQKIEAFQGMN